MSVVSALSAMASAGERVTVVVVPAGALARLVKRSDQLASAPVFDAASSWMRSFHVPLGFSPRKACRRPSGESGVATTRFVNTRSVTGSLA